MRNLVVVATTNSGNVNRFPKTSVLEASNLKDFLEQTGEYAKVGVYELEKELGPLKQWAELEQDER